MFRPVHAPRVAEFFAGIGLVRMALEQEGCRIVFANDIAAEKRQLYAANFDASDYLLADVRHVTAADIPDIDVAAASFPCTDVSLAGARAGLRGEQSGTFWEFVRILAGMRERRPAAILLENVAGLSTSRGGDDLREAIAALNDLAYWCDVFVVDARWFVPQSRARLFIVGSVDAIDDGNVRDPGPCRPFLAPSDLRPAWLIRFAMQHPELRLRSLPLMRPPTTEATLADVVERLSADDERWWDAARLGAFVTSLSPINAARVDRLRSRPGVAWATAYRRTRHGRPMWEIRSDAISGCLRTSRGGSSKQALVEVGIGELRVRWMTAREYARLQGAPDYNLDGARPLQAMFGFGDGVCVPAVAWIARNYLVPLVRGNLARTAACVGN